MTKLQKILNKTDLTRIFSYFFTTLVVLLSSSVIFFIIWKSVYFLSHQDGLSFLVNTEWDPEHNKFGFWNILLATFWTLLFVMILVYFINKFASIFISSFLPESIRRKVIFFLQFLSGLPSILFGVFVSLVVLEIFKHAGITSPKSMLAAIIVLVFMILPTTLSLTINKLRSSSAQYEYTAHALGLQKTNIIFDVVYKNAHKKILLILLYGFFRAIGEVTAVALVAGNSTNAPDLAHGLRDFFLKPVMLLSPLIGIEIKENFGANHESALFTAALLIMIVVFFTNTFVLLFVGNFDWKKKIWNRVKQKLPRKKTTTTAPASSWENWMAITRFRYWRGLHYVRYFGMIVASTIVIGFFSWIVCDVVVKGLAGFSFPALVKPSGNDGLLSMLFITILLIIGTLLFSVPIAFFTAVYLKEYAKKGSRFAKGVQFLMFQLASAPSILFGMFGFVLFVSLMGFGYSILSASLTMILVVFPLIVKTITQNLESIPENYRHVAFALGMTHQQVIWHVVIPNALKGIAISLIFAANRIISEVSPYIIILGGGTRFPHRGFLSTGRTLSTQMYYLQSESPATMTATEINNLTYQTALITLIVVFLINITIDRMNRKSSIKK